VQTLKKASLMSQFISFLFFNSGNQPGKGLVCFISKYAYINEGLTGLTDIHLVPFLIGKNSKRLGQHLLIAYYFEISDNY